MMNGARKIRGDDRVMTAWIFPIRYKILLMLSAVVIAAVAFYLALAAKIFREDKTLLVYELAETNVRTLGADLEANLSKTLDKMRLFALLARRAGQDPAAQRSLDDFAANETDLLWVGLVEPAMEAGSPPRLLSSRAWPDVIKAAGRDETFAKELEAKCPVPLERLASQSVWVRNITTPDEATAPVWIIAMAVKEKNSVALPQVIMAAVRLDSVLASFAAAGIAQVYAVDSEGHALAHSDQSLVRGDALLSDDPLVSRASASKVRSEVVEYSHGGREFVGAYHRLGLAAVSVVSRIERSEAFAAARTLIQKSLIYAAIVITSAFLVSLFFSHSLTEPLSRLVDATQKVAGGDLGALVQVKSHDEIAGLAKSFNTMTDKLRASREEILEYSHTLEQKVADRTAQLESQNVAIKEAQEALVRTTRLASVGEVAGRAAHEVLNPLTNIAARLERMREGARAEEQQDFQLLGDILVAWREALLSGGPAAMVEALSKPSTVDPAKTLLEEDLGNLESIARDLGAHRAGLNNDVDFLLSESGRINRIVNGMRSLTRVSADRKPVDINGVAADGAATMADVLRKHRISLETRFCGGAPKVVSDRDELIQVLSNLLRNSMQAMDEARADKLPHGEPARVWIETQRGTGPDGVARIFLRVGDNGPGIAVADQSRIFEPSFTTKPSEEGTGLGLSIARRFIRASEGDITLESSEPGVATVFLIDLPEVVNGNA